FRSSIAAQVDDFEPTDFMERALARRLDRYAQYAVAATRAAIDDARFDAAAADPTRVAVIMGSALGGIAHAQDQMTNLILKGPKAVDPRVSTFAFAGAASCQVAIEFGFTGPNSTNAMSCASGTMA